MTHLTLSEKDLQKHVVATAKMLGWTHIYHTWSSMNSGAGFPDLVMTRGGRLIFAELKTDKGKLTGGQKDWLDALRLVAGAEVYVWRPAAWYAGEIDRVLKGALPVEISLK